MTVMSGNVVSFEIGEKGDSTSTTVILEVRLTDTDDIRPVEWIPAPGEDSVPLIGSRVIVHRISSGYLVATGGNDGAVPVSEEGGKEIYSAAKDSSTVKKMARVRCLPDGSVEIIADPAGSISLGNGTDEVVSLFNDNLTEVIAGLKYIRDESTYSNGGGPTGPPSNGALLSPIITSLEATQTALGNIKA